MANHQKARRRRRTPTARQRLGRPKPRVAPPSVHIQIACAGTRLDEACALVKPAILYADQVTLFSPAASMLNSVEQFAAVTDPRQRALVMLEAMDAVPDFRAQLNIDPATFGQLRQYLALDPALLDQLARFAGIEDHIAELHRHIDALEPIWESQFPDALAQVRENFGADDLITAIESGIVVVADLMQTNPPSVVGQSVNAALGGAADDLLDNMILSFTGRLIEILSDHRSFPIFDAEASGLITALERDAVLTISDLTLRHAAEVTSASGVLGYLPSFPRLPIDELIDLRNELSEPLARFRAEWSKISKEFRSRAFDAAFEAEIEEVWRTRVEPALAEVRERLAEHGFLRQSASITRSNAVSLLAEAGGVVGLAHVDSPSLSSIMTAVLAAALPAADTACRALAQAVTAQRDVSKHPFFFVHRVAEEAARLSTSDDST